MSSSSSSSSSSSGAVWNCHFSPSSSLPSAACNNPPMPLSPSFLANLPSSAANGAVCVVPVGLPARGKSYMSIKLGRYLRWLGIRTAVFSVGAYRRRISRGALDGKYHAAADASGQHTKDHASPTTPERDATRAAQAEFAEDTDPLLTSEARKDAAGAALADMLQFLALGGVVAIYDDTLTIRALRRAEIVNSLGAWRVHVLFVEAICEVQHVVESNVREVKVPRAGALYKSWDIDEAVRDYMERIERYRPLYDTLNVSATASPLVLPGVSASGASASGAVPVTDPKPKPVVHSDEGGAAALAGIARAPVKVAAAEAVAPLDALDADPVASCCFADAPLELQRCSFIKVTNMGVDEDFAEHIVASNVRGYLQTRILLFLLNLHIAPRTIYLLPNPAVRENTCFRDDAGLDANAIEYACRARDKLNEILAPRGDRMRLPKVYTSTRRCSNETALYLRPLVPADRIVQKASLVQLNPGAVDGMGADEIRLRYPDEYESHQRDSFKHRYPRGESYYNLAVRIESVILELEDEKEDVLIIAHNTVLRCLYAYLMDIPEGEISGLSFPEETLIELAPDFYGKKKVYYHNFARVVRNF